MGTKITFRSRKDTLNVYAEDEEQAETVLRNYLGVSYGGLEMNERANAEEYYASFYHGKKRGVELIQTETIYTHDKDEEVEVEVGFLPLEEYL